MLLATIAKLLLYGGVTLVAGDVSLRRFRVLDATGSAADVRPSVRRALRALWAALALLLLAQVRDLELGADYREYAALLTDTGWGHAWLLLVAAVLVTHLAVTKRWRTSVQVASVALLAFAMGGLGHAAADSSPYIGRLLDMLHVLGVGAWLGGLYFVARRAVHEHQGEAWRTFSKVATIAAPLVVLTGFAASVRRVGGVGAGEAYRSDYGRLLLIKLALALVVLAFGAIHRQRTVKRRPSGAVYVHAELAFAALVFLVTSVLTGTAPPGE